jgi:hypothetical protein
LINNAGVEPHVIWIGHDDHYLLVSTEIHRTKFANICTTLKVAVVLVDASKHYRYVEIREDGVDVVRGLQARSHIDTLSRKYTACRCYPNIGECRGG